MGQTTFGTWGVVICGLIGFFAHSSAPIPERGLGLGLDRMARRGPDSSAVWTDQTAWFGHRRLAIIDLDERSAQPMHSPCGRYVIIFNGEIYNYRSLRDLLRLRGIFLRTSSDTEVIVALFALEGESMLQRLHGMFAFVIWDKQTMRAFAARDPYGIKPLYIASVPNGIILASQVKAILATGLVSREPDQIGQAGFWMLGSVPEPRTWFRMISALPAGTCAWIENGRVTTKRCWHDIGEVWREAEECPRPTTRELSAAVKAQVQDSVRRHLVADVPVGVLLSGGIDSVVLTALMLESGYGALQGVTLAYDEFRGSRLDESQAAALAAKEFGIRHTVRRVTREEFLEDLPRILHAMDQPSIDGVNTWYASKAVAELGLKVVVSGVGGDELFQGYAHFRTLPRLVSARMYLRDVPGVRFALRTAGDWQAKRTGNSRWKYLEEWTRTIEGAWWLRHSICAPDRLPSLIGEERAREVLRDFDVVEQVRAMTGALPADLRLALGQIESMTFMRNQLLRDSDWASMDHSLELRTPLVDAHLLAGLRPLLRAFEEYPNKQLLAQCAQHRLPANVGRRPKIGFGIPVSRWLTGTNQHLATAWAPVVGAECYSSGR